jgi:glucose/mannose-6-phosphate isomerase
MDLDQYQNFARLDPGGMLAHIDDLPDQLRRAWDHGMSQTLPAMSGIRQVLVAGMGGSAIGADLLAAYLEPISSAPVFIQRDYNLPAWAAGEQTLVIASSHSGNTEETLSVFEQARHAGCQLFVISTGGQLSEEARKASAKQWLFEHHGQPRSAVGYSFGLLLALFYRLGLIPDPLAELEEAVRVMKQQQESLLAETPVVNNPAKRQAGQLVGRGVLVIGSGLLAPVARRWKGQINELAKAWAGFDQLPEADHNTIAGIENPEPVLTQMSAIFLRAPSDHPRNRLRSELTARAFMLAGIGTDYYLAKGEGRLAHLWSALHFGDYVAYYLAMIYGADPTLIPAIEQLKQAMKD